MICLVTPIRWELFSIIVTKSLPLVGSGCSKGVDNSWPISFVGCANIHGVASVVRTESYTARNTSFAVTPSGEASDGKRVGFGYFDHSDEHLRVDTGGLSASTFSGAAIHATDNRLPVSYLLDGILGRNRYTACH